MPRSSIPISNILESSVVTEYLTRIDDTCKQEGFFIGDYGSGRNAEVPLFFTKEYHQLFPDRPTLLHVYCIDMHTLRLENMFGQFLEEGVTSNARVVFAKLETMISHAVFPYEQDEYLKRNPRETTSLDYEILNKKHLPPGCFHLGIMNKDLLGYMSEYYDNDTDMSTSLESIRNTLHQDALLLVTQPCVMYRVDNLRILRDNGFQLKEIVDVDLKVGSASILDESTSIDSFSKPNHYSFIVLSKK